MKEEGSSVIHPRPIKNPIIPANSMNKAVYSLVEVAIKEADQICDFLKRLKRIVTFFNEYHGLGAIKWRSKYG